jgi:hypothetical protein
MASARSQRLELVDVVLTELVGQELVSDIDQWFLGKGAREQQRPRVSRGQEDGVHGKQGMDGPYHFSVKGPAA